MFMEHSVPSHQASSVFLTITLGEFCRLKIKSPCVCPSAQQKHPFLHVPSFIGFRHHSHRWNDKWLRLTIARSGKEGSRQAQTGRGDSNQFSSLSCNSQVIVTSAFIIFFKIAFQRFSSFHSFASPQNKKKKSKAYVVKQLVQGHIANKKPTQDPNLSLMPFQHSLVPFQHSQWPRTHCHINSKEILGK